MSELTFMGHVLSTRGIGLENVKVKAVADARPPKNASEVRSFLGLVNYNGRFIRNLATIAETIRRLTRKGARFEWGDVQDNSFNELKNELCNAKGLAYFDKNSETQVMADASSFGPGGVLIQEQQGQNVS